MWYRCEMCIRDSYVYENWTLTKYQTSRIEADEMRFIKHVAGYTFQDRKRNVGVLQEQNIMSILDSVAQYRLKWLEHHNRLPHTPKNY